MKKVGSEKPMKASVVAIWSKNEYGRTRGSRCRPAGRPGGRGAGPSPSTKSVVGSRCMIRVSTLMRLTKEKPQSPRSMELNQRT